MRRILLAEHDERAQAAASLQALGKTAEAAVLRTEMTMIAGYLGQVSESPAINSDDGSL